MPKLIMYASAIAAAFAANTAVAQGVTINLVTPQQTSCAVTTDVRGVDFDSATKIYSATATSMTGEGCTVGGGGDFRVTLSAPPTAQLGVPFYITWSTTASSAVCVFGSPVSGMSGWNAGMKACQGPSCAGTHTQFVTPTAPGAYTFSMICTNSTGYSEASITVH